MGKGAKLACVVLLSTHLFGCNGSDGNSSGDDAQTREPSEALHDQSARSSDRMWASRFLGTVDIIYRNGRMVRTGAVLIDEQTVAMSASKLFGAESARVFWECCAPRDIAEVIGYDAALDIALVHIESPLTDPGTIPVRELPTGTDAPLRIVLALPLRIEEMVGYTELETQVVGLHEWSGYGEAIVFQSEPDIVLDGSIVVDHEGYPLAFLNGWGGSEHDLGIRFKRVLQVERHEPIKMSDFTPSSAPAEHRSFAFAYHAQTLRNREQYDDAYASLLDCLELNPDQWLGLYELGVLQDMMGNDLQGAAETMRESIAAEDAWSESHYSLGLIEYKRGKYQEAIESLRLADQLDPFNPDVHQMLGLSLMELEGAESALPNMERAQDLAPDVYMYLSNLVFAYKEAGKPTLARDRLLRFVDENPDEPEGRSGLGYYWIQQREPELALEQFEWLDLNTETTPEILVRVAFCLMETGDRLKAEETLDRLAAMDAGHELLPVLRKRLEQDD